MPLDLSAVEGYPIATARHTFGGTTAVEVTFPTWASSVSIRAIGGDVNLASTGVDGDAPVEGYPIDDGGGIGFSLADGPRRTPARVLYVAGVAGQDVAFLLTAGF